MMRFAFRKGLRFFEGHRIWAVMRRLMSGVIQLEDPSGEVRSMRDSEVMQKYVSGEFTIDAESLSSDGSSCHIVVPRDLSTYKPEEQEVALWRKSYLDRLESFPTYPAGAELLQKLAEIARELGDSKPPSATSIHRWKKRYGDTRDVVALISRDANKGRRSSLTARTIEIIDGHVDEILLNKQQYPKKVVVENVHAHFKRLKESHPDAKDLIAPSKASIYRYLNRLYKYQVDVARLGKNAANLLHWASLGQIKVNRIHERWEIDHTPLDLLVFCEQSGLPMGRPWLTIIMDKKSRYILGFYISFRNPSANAVLQAVVHAILPKEEFLSRYPDIQAKWLAGGIGENIVCDNGMDLHSGSFVATCYEIGLSVVFCPAKTPQYKGSVERFFRTINHDLIHQLPGTVFNSYKKRGEYESEKHAAISFQKLTHLVTKWIVEVYHQTPHRTLKTTPQQAWINGMAERVIEYPAYPDQLRIIAGEKETRSLFRYGIEFDCLKYNNELLQSIRRRTGKTITLDFKHFEDDVSYIQVFDPMEKIYIRVDAVNQEYAQGLHRVQHNMICKEATARQWDKTDVDRLMEVKAEIRSEVVQSIKDKKMINRKNAARARGVDSNAPTGYPVDEPTIHDQDELSADEDEMYDDDIPDFFVQKGQGTNNSSIQGV